MPIPWDTIRPALLSLFNDLSGLQTIWINKRRPFIDPSAQAVVMLRVRQTESIGVDERRFEDLGTAAPAFPYEESQNGHRRVGLDVRVESFRHDDDRFAFNAAGRIRTRLRFGSSQTRLLALNIALVRAGAVLDLSGIVKDDRAVSVANLDLILNVGICVANEGAANLVPAIETVDNPFDNPSTVFNPPC